MKLRTARDVRDALMTRREIAILDLRGEAPYALDHPLFAASLPLGQIEARARTMIPRADAPIVVYDDGEGLVGQAITRLVAMGFTDVAALEGGLGGWRAAGYELFQDVNSASKAFGELVESRRHTPSIPAPEAKALIESEPNLVVLDARRFDEYRNMSIPRGMSVPGAELVLRARAIAPDPTTTIIVNCAGRTRSIIGTQSLVNAGLPNPIMALRNGTIGWTLAGQELEHGREARFPVVDEAQRAAARDAARAVSYRAGVRRLDLAGLCTLAADTTRTLYRFDVRQPEEFVAGHLPRFVNAPGGQLVQETDAFAPVRGARLVLADDLGPRADMSASWLAQMGWEVYVLDGGFDGALETGEAQPDRPAPPAVTLIDADTLAATQGLRVIDVATSPTYRRGHIPGAAFAIRSRLGEIVTAIGMADVVVTSDDGYLARFAANELAELLGRRVRGLDGGTAAWTAAGRALEAGSGEQLLVPDDVYRRPYEGTDNPASAMQAYLDWEYGLVAQLESDGTHGFFVI